jgi:hypothetical protein
VELDSVAKVVAAWYRLVGSISSDGALTEQGEATDDVVYTYLTRGYRNAQRWMLKMGYGGWRKRTTALTWSGSDAADGGRYATLPSDFLRSYGNQRMSALREAGGDQWGQEVKPEEDQLQGDYYYIRGEQLWLGRDASPPTTLYFDYHYKHPLWSASVTIDFPMDARALIVAEAANVAKEENWLPGGPEMEQKIERALMRAREEAREIVRVTKGPRTLRKPPRYGNRW